MLRTRCFPVSLLGVFVVFAAAPAWALPVGKAEEAREAELSASSLPEIEAGSVDFTAIVALPNCSGSLVRFTTSRPDDAALILTNGHCVGGSVPADGAIVSQPSGRSFSLLSSSGRSTLGTLRATELVYATMSNTDLALYRLTATYAELASRYRVTPLTISEQHPAVNDPIRVVSGFWRKVYSCTIAKFVYRLKEGSFTFTDSIRLSEPGCETKGGTSGAPIIHADTREIIGINNTGNENGQRCTLNNPCEVDEHGVTVAEKGASYGQELYLLYTCLSDTNQIDLSRAGCLLAKPHSF